MHEAKNIATKMPQPRYSREDRAMPLYISIRIEFYNGIARFLCHSTAFLCSPTPTVLIRWLLEIRWKPFH